MLPSRRLILAHFWLAFAAFGVALVLGVWQMFVRSPLYGGGDISTWYYRSVTAHGTAMAYALPTLVAMGFGYAISESALEQPLIGRRWAWLGWALVLIGAVAALTPVALGLASVLYTFYPPLIGNAFYYIGVVLVVVGSWIWVALMSVNLRAWKRAHAGAPVPLAMFANVAARLVSTLSLSSPTPRVPRARRLCRRSLPRLTPATSLDHDALAGALRAPDRIRGAVGRGGEGRECRDRASRRSPPA